jgi:hypothetical protein
MRIIYNQKNSKDSSYGMIEFWENSNLICSVKGNLKEFLQWLISVKECILKELFFYGSETNSLAKRLNFARNIEFNEELSEDNLVSDYWHEQIFEYYKKHGLVFGLRGFNNQNLIIGKNLKKGELSCYEDGMETLRFQFDLNDFFNEVELMLKELENMQ